MRSESLQESLSAFMDGEAGELEIRRVLQATEQDPAVRSTWERYQTARAVMHKEPWQGKIDLSAGIAAALADEPALGTPARKSAGIWQTASKFAVAASVTVAVLVGVRMMNQEATPTQPALAERSAVEQAPVAAPAAAPAAQSGSAVLAGFPATAESAQAVSGWHEERIEGYLRQHAEQGAQTATPHLVPQARAASLDNK
ncbi:MAG TPA: RNA polymerase subunit sigma [Pseudomonas xinjiangensis]|uniref:RNA polymerase subunit sigma n=2 Tax=root TaxID=1 RepID=A0A7V1BNM1_9GAMM|nr:RNA polymerase subunit sigma [Halopseudomonas xinjiangensis]HEC46921.1 RNA polymerase subunit sigma [Halopseudomonas xinjiangensis]